MQYIYGAHKPVTRTIFIPSDKILNKHAASWPAKTHNLRLKEARRKRGEYSSRGGASGKVAL